MGAGTASEPADVPTLLIAGQVEDEDELLNAGFRCVRAVTPADMPLARALQKETAQANIRQQTATILKEIF